MDKNNKCHQPTEDNTTTPPMSKSYIANEDKYIRKELKSILDDFAEGMGFTDKKDLPDAPIIKTASISLWGHTWYVEFEKQGKSPALFLEWLLYNKMIGVHIVEISTHGIYFFKIHLNGLERMHKKAAKYINDNL